MTMASRRTRLSLDMLSFPRSMARIGGPLTPRMRVSQLAGLVLPDIPGFVVFIFGQTDPRARAGSDPGRVSVRENSQ
jgi:hypothetical protein